MLLSALGGGAQSTAGFGMVSRWCSGNERVCLPPPPVSIRLEGWAVNLERYLRMGLSPGCLVQALPGADYDLRK